MNRVVVEISEGWEVKVRAEHPEEVTVFFLDRELADRCSDYTPQVFGVNHAEIGKLVVANGAMMDWLGVKDLGEIPF